MRGPAVAGARAGVLPSRLSFPTCEVGGWGQRHLPAKRGRFRTSASPTSPVSSRPGAGAARGEGAHLGWWAAGRRRLVSGRLVSDRLQPDSGSAGAPALPAEWVGEARSPAGVGLGAVPGPAVRPFSRLCTPAPTAVRTPSPPPPCRPPPDFLSVKWVQSPTRGPQPQRSPVRFPGAGSSFPARSPGLALRRGVAAAVGIPALRRALRGLRGPSPRGGAALDTPSRGPAPRVWGRGRPRGSPNPQGAKVAVQEVWLQGLAPPLRTPRSPRPGVLREGHVAAPSVSP